ncbi:hypothetical protein GCM10023235_15920 [Kitasatospora terrestris]|uniref:HTH hxlR-type domain-containing protein n=1 Tax=Kitasatospora terrestris TaxID=258051 RepID=A0ABP9DDB2_9ACTN
MERWEAPDGPSHVEYRLTDLGRTLPAPIGAVGAGGFEHGDEVTAAQDAAEAGDAGPAVPRLRPAAGS